MSYLSHRKRAYKSDIHKKDITVDELVADLFSYSTDDMVNDLLRIDIVKELLEEPVTMESQHV